MNTKHGDLIFCLVGPKNNPISQVGNGYNNSIINHCGIINKTTNSTMVIEAYPGENTGVQSISLTQFLERSCFNSEEPRILIGSVSEVYTPLLNSAIEFAKLQIGLPYDHLYSEDKTSLYCSELILDMFNHAHGSYTVFPKSPLVFHDIETGELLPHWKNHYLSKGLPIPYDSMGSHPGSLSKSPNINIHTIKGDLFI